MLQLKSLVAPFALNQRQMIERKTLLSMKWNNIFPVDVGLFEMYLKPWPYIHFHFCISIIDKSMQLQLAHLYIQLSNFVLYRAHNFSTSTFYKKDT